MTTAWRHHKRAEWDPALAELVAWFREHRATLPREPFRLAPGVRVADPIRFYASLDLDLNIGPDGCRSVYGGLEFDLRHLRRLFDPAATTNINSDKGSNPRPDARTLHRTIDHRTSIVAASQLLPHLSKLQGRVLRAIRRESQKRGDVTDGELEVLPEFSRCRPTTVRKRRLELERMGLVKPTNRSRAGMQCWQPVPMADVLLEAARCT